MRRFSPVPLVILAAWVFMIGLLVKREYFTAEPQWRPGIAHLDTTLVEEWTGIYLQGQKIGYGYTSRIAEGDTLVRVNATQLYRIEMLGQTQVINIRMEATLLADYSLRSFLFAMNTDNAQSSLMTLNRPRTALGTSLEIQGGVDGRILKVEVRQGGEAKGREEVIPVDGPIYLDVGPNLLLAEQGLEVGRTIRVPSLDPVTLRVASVALEVAGIDTLDFQGARVVAYRLETEIMGIRLRSWVDEHGQQLRAELPLGITVERESEEQALEQGWDHAATLDLVNLASVPAGVMKIEGARQVDSMTVHITGVELTESNMTFGRQELIEQIVKVRTEDVDRLEDYELPNTDRALRPYLRPTTFVESDDRRIGRRAQSVARGERSARTVAETLVHYVYEYLEKVPTAGVPTALEVLNRRQGDCNEHTVFFTALARALGLPTLMNAGVVYQDGRFYYHAWPSVWLGEWVAVDPTFDQFPADATHISFIRGGIDRQVELMKVIGRVGIDVVNYHPIPGGVPP